MCQSAAVAVQQSGSGVGGANVALAALARCSSRMTVHGHVHGRDLDHTSAFTQITFLTPPQI